MLRNLALKREDFGLKKWYYSIMQKVGQDLPNINHDACNQPPFEQKRSAGFCFALSHNSHTQTHPLPPKFREVMLHGTEEPP